MPAEAETSEKREYSPIIVIPGIGQSPVDYYDPDGSLAVDENGRELGGYHTMIVADTRGLARKLRKTLLPRALASLLLQADLGLSKAVGKIMAEVLAAHECGPDGRLTHNLKARRTTQSVAEMDEADRRMFYRQFPVEKLVAGVGEDRAFFFAFGMMGDAIRTAGELDEFIQTVKEKTGCPKVTLVNVSLGGSVYVAYLDMFKGKGDLDSVINMVAVLDGTDAVADLYARDFSLYDRFVYGDLLPHLLETLGMGFKEPGMGSLLSAALRLLPRKAYENILVAVFDFWHTNLLVNNAQIWATVPLARYPALRERWLGDPEHAALRERIDAAFGMQKRFDQNTRDAVQQGVRINNICGYGLRFGDVEYFIFGCVRSAGGSNADGVIHIQSASQGAACVPAGSRFPAEYAQRKPSAQHPGYSYISPDRSIDASACVLPDNTWFFGRQHHEAGRNDVMINLAAALYTDPELRNVHSKPDVWPQFNGCARTDWMRNDWLPRAEGVLAHPGLALSADLRAELEAATRAAQALVEGAIADDARTKAVGKRLTNALHAAGIVDFNDRQPVTPSRKRRLLRWLLKFLDDLYFHAVGARGFSDWWRQPKYPGFWNGFGVTGP